MKNQLHLLYLFIFKTHINPQLKFQNYGLNLILL
jgi:hypothetical protein